MTLRKLLPLMLVALLGAACGAPSAVEGEVEGRPWTVRDLEPELKTSKRTGDAQIVLADQSGEQLRTVVVFVEQRAELSVDEPIAFGDGVRLSVSEGELETLESGAVNAKDPVFHGVVKGEIVFTSLGDPIVGEFWAELENGGYIEGSFVLEGSLR